LKDNFAGARSVIAAYNYVYYVMFTQSRCTIIDAQKLEQAGSVTSRSVCRHRITY